MTSYNPGRKWTHKIAIVAATIAIGVGALEFVAGAMTHPDPEALAARQQFIAAEYDRAYEIRALERGDVRVADVAGASASR
jgi:hypothetical protein